MPIDLITAKASDFENFVSETFKLETEGGIIELTLDNVKTSEGKSIRDNHLEVDGVFYPPRQAFALTFEGPREPVLDSKCYTMKHATLGEIELFISAFRQDNSCTLYESAFS